MLDALIAAVRLSIGLTVLSVFKTVKGFKDLYWSTYAYIWDVELHILNQFAPERDPNKVIPPNKPGAYGDWSRYTYFPPTGTDARSPCPALNALCNIGVMPRNGRNIKFTDCSDHLRDAYNLSPSLTFGIMLSIAKLFKKDYFNDSFDLDLFNTHNVIEHDASLIRHDAYIEQNQAKPADDLITSLLKYATGAAIVKKQRIAILTPADIAAFSRKRRADCKAHNPQYTLKFIHKFFSSNNNAIMYDTFGGRVEDLRTWLIEERFPQGWQPRITKRYGYTMTALNFRTIQIMVWSEPPPFVVPPKRPINTELYSM